jgi:hypothetical protein
MKELGENMMAARKPPRSKEQIAKDLKEALNKVKADMRDEIKKAENHKAIILGKTLQLRAKNGNANAKRELDEILAGLTRDQDRRAFGLDPLPGNPPADPSAKPPSAADVAAATARLDAARIAFNTGKLTPEVLDLQAAFVEAAIVFERLTGSFAPTIPPQNREGFGLGDRPGERLKAS